MPKSNKPSKSRKPVEQAPQPAPEPQPAQEPVPKMSMLDAAFRVLSQVGKAMGCKELIGVMAGKGYWISPGGKTPHATLSSALLREITVKGLESRFKKVGPGQFAVNTPAA